MVGKRVGSRQMLWWETERGRRGGEGRAEKKRVGGSGRGKEDSPQGTSTMTGRTKRETSTVFVVELNPG